MGIFRMVAPKGDKGDTGPPGSLVEVGSANYDITTPGTYVGGSGGGIDISDVDENSVLAFTVGGVGLIGPRLYWLFGNFIRDRDVGDMDISDVEPGAGNLTIYTASSSVSIAFGRDSNDKLAVTMDARLSDPMPLTLYKMGSTTVPPLQPHISGFISTSGSLSPVAGSIGTLSYGVEWSISQSSHLGAARIVGFKGTAANPTSVAVLKTLASSEYAHGSGNVVIPGGVSLAADGVYTLRLEIYHENDDPATQLPRGYQDIRITAHDAATADYHIGNLLYRAADDTVAKQIARITDFSGDTETTSIRPTRLTINAPEDTNEYRPYLIVKATATQPTGFTSANLPATSSFYPVQDKTISSVAYKVYLVTQDWRLTHEDNGDYFGIEYG